MRRLRVVLDTNVLVAGALRRRGASARILAVAMPGGFVVLYDYRIRGEYRRVLELPELGLDEIAVDRLLLKLKRSGRLVRRRAMPIALELPDEGDRMFIEVARTGRADVVITHNHRDFPQAIGIDVGGPAAVLRRLGIDPGRDL